MNKDILKVKELLHLELFKKIPKDELGPDRSWVHFTEHIHIKNSEFQKILLQLGEPEPCDTYWLGVINKSVFWLYLVHQTYQTTYFHVYYSKDCDENHIKEDFPLLKKFLEHKKVSHE